MFSISVAHTVEVKGLGPLKWLPSPNVLTMVYKLFSPSFLIYIIGENNYGRAHSYFNYAWENHQT